MYKKVKCTDGSIKLVTSSYILKEGEVFTEEEPEDTEASNDSNDSKESGQEEAATTSDDVSGSAEEKALLNKIKSIVVKTVDTKLSEKEAKILMNRDFADSKSKAFNLMNSKQKVQWQRIKNDVERADFEDRVVIANYLKALYRNDYATVKDLSEGTDSEGGYLVPTPLSNKVYEIVTAQGLARREMSVVPMSSKSLDLTTLTTKPVVYYPAEGAQITASDLVFGRKTLTAAKMAAITAMSNEVVEDANIDLVNFNIQKIAEALMEEEDGAFFNTSSSANIEGLLEATTNTVTMGTGDTSFANLAYGDLVDVIYTIGARQRKGAKWCFSSYITSLVMKLTDSQNRPIWSRATEGQPAMLLGYPVLENDEMPDSGDDGVSTEFLVFGNFKKYLIGDRKKMTATILKEGTIGSTNLAEQDSTGLRVIQRVSGIAPTPLEFVTLKTAAS